VLTYQVRPQSGDVVITLDEGEEGATAAPRPQWNLAWVKPALPRSRAVISSMPPAISMSVSVRAPSEQAAAERWRSTRTACRRTEVSVRSQSFGLTAHLVHLHCPRHRRSGRLQREGVLHHDQLSGKPLWGRWVLAAKNRGGRLEHNRSAVARPQDDAHVGSPSADGRFLWGRSALTRKESSDP
jgi:hypothetical protein